MKYNISLLFLSLFLINAKTFTMDNGMTSGLTPKQAAQWQAQNTILDYAATQIQNLATGMKALDLALSRTPSGYGIAQAPAAQVFNFCASRPVPQPNPFAPENTPSRIPDITPARLFIAAGIAWTIGEAKVAYDSFSAKEKANAGKLKLPFLVALRTGKNMLARPGQIVGLPSKLVGLLEKKVAHSN